MEKALSSNGHSVALVIDKPIARMLGLSCGSLVRLTIEGGCLIVTPLGGVKEMPSRPAAARRHAPTKRTSITTRDVLRLLGDLDAYGMPDREFRRINGGQGMVEFGGLANSGFALDPTTLDRMARCMKRRQADMRESWETTVDMVLQEVLEPEPSTPYSGNSSGLPEPDFGTTAGYSGCRSKSPTEAGWIREVSARHDD